MRLLKTLVPTDAGAQRVCDTSSTTAGAGWFRGGSKTPRGPTASPREPVFAWAGLWRVSDEWAPVYSGLMTHCNEAIRSVHDRMRVILRQNDWGAWLHGAFADAVAFQARVLPPELVVMERTAEPWGKPTVPVA